MPVVVVVVREVVVGRRCGRGKQASRVSTLFCKPLAPWLFILFDIQLSYTQPRPSDS